MMKDEVVEMAKKKKEMDCKTREILDSAFGSDVSTLRDLNVRSMLIDYINSEIRVNENNENISIGLTVTDSDKKHWMKNEHFIKIFHHEIRHAEEYYSLTRGEKHFILDLAEFLRWEMNILVDEFDAPLNQVSLAEKLDIDVRTVRRNMTSLQKKHIIHKVEISNEAYYIINPYLIFIGQYINLSIPKLFDGLGYVNSGDIVKEGRSNRRKDQEKRINIRVNG